VRRIGRAVGFAEVLLEIHAGCERVALAREHEHRAAVVCRERLDGAAHLFVERRAHRVAFLRAIEHHPGDALVELDQHELAPGFLLSSHSLSPQSLVRGHPRPARLP
jgi:hypothetical protein